jgi:transcriptional regulator with XRE-family HTH domain
VKGAQFVREARKRASLTQAQLADRAGTTKSALARIESGRVAPTFERIVELVRACGFDLNTRLVPYDDSEWSVATWSLQRTPTERVQGNLNAVRFAAAGRIALRDARRR